MAEPFLTRPEPLVHIRVISRQLYHALAPYYRSSCADRDTLAALLDDDIGKLSEVIRVLFWLSRDEREAMLGRRSPRTVSTNRERS